MRSWLLAYLKCPACPDAPVRLVRKDEAHTIRSNAASDEIVVSGVLECVACRARYPILSESPRLLAEQELTPEEREVLRAPVRPATHGGDPVEYSKEQIAAMVADRIMADYGRPAAGPALRRAQEDIAYQRTYEENRVYQMRLLRNLIGHTPALIVDVGGGRGGNLRAALNAFDFRHGIVVDIDSKWPPLFRTGDRRLAYVRANATRLPLRSRCADLTISSFLLEHVHQWKAVVLEMRRLSDSNFVAFGPNRAFPYEIGHVNAPLAHTLPLPLGAFVACLWDRLNGNHRSYQRLREILAGMNYITSRTYYSFCRSSGIPLVNIFPDVLQAWAEAGGSGKRAMLAKHPGVLRALARALAMAGLEPNVYSLLVDA
jgi:uncharacterized protein YbaR (Trm112 family)